MADHLFDLQRVEMRKQLFHQMMEALVQNSDDTCHRMLT